MGRFKHLVDIPAHMEGFRAKYHIPQGVALQYCAPDQVMTHREEGKVFIPMIAFIKEGMTLPMSRVTQDYLINHRLSICTSIWVWDSPGTMLSICTSATCLLTQGITSSPDPPLLDLCHVFPSPIKAWRTTTWSPLGNGTMVFTVRLGRESQVGVP